MTREARSAGAAIAKRSLLVAGHATSISLEDAFWVALKAAAKRRGLAVAALVAAIDAERGAANLSSAIRVFLLREAGATPDLDVEPREGKTPLP